MRLVHCLLLVCTLLTRGDSQSNQGCETFDEYDIDPKKDYHYIGTAEGEDEAKCCAYCIANLTGCTAYVFVARDNLCYFKNITDLRKKMTPNSNCKAGIVRQTTTLRSSHHSFTSSEYIRRKQNSDLPEMQKTSSTAIYIVWGIGAVGTLEVIVGIFMLMKDRRVGLLSTNDQELSQNTEVKDVTSALSHNSVSIANDSVTADMEH